MFKSDELRLILIFAIFLIAQVICSIDFDKFHCDHNFYKDYIAGKKLEIKIINRASTTHIHFYAIDRVIRRPALKLNILRPNEFTDLYHPYEKGHLRGLEYLLKETTYSVFLYDEMNRFYISENGREMIMFDREENSAGTFATPHQQLIAQYQRYREYESLHIYTIGDTGAYVFELRKTEFKFDQYGVIPGKPVRTNVVKTPNYEPTCMLYDEGILFILSKAQDIYVYRWLHEKLVLYTKLTLGQFLQCDMSLSEGGLLRGIIRSKNASTVFVQTYYYQVPDGQDLVKAMRGYLPINPKYVLGPEKLLGSHFDDNKDLFAMNEATWFHQLIENSVYLKTSRLFKSYKVNDYQSSFEFQKDIPLTPKYQIIGIIEKDDKLAYFFPDGYLVKNKNDLLSSTDIALTNPTQLNESLYIFRFNEDAWDVDREFNIKLLNSSYSIREKSNEDEITEIKFVYINGTICAFITRIHYSIRPRTLLFTAIFLVIICAILFTVFYFYFKSINKRNKLERYEEVYQKITVPDPLHTPRSPSPPPQSYGSPQEVVVDPQQPKTKVESKVNEIFLKNKVNSKIGENRRQSNAGSIVDENNQKSLAALKVEENNHKSKAGSRMDENRRQSNAGSKVEENNPNSKIVSKVSENRRESDAGRKVEENVSKIKTGPGG